MNLNSICTQIQNDPDSIPWTEKIALIAALAEGLGSHSKLPPQAAIALNALATDGKWEVRKAVADLLHLVPEAHFMGLASLLGNDDNHYVRTTAQKALNRRSRSKPPPRKGRGLKKAETELDKLARTHGDEVAKMVRDQAVRLYEGLVGASVHELRAVLAAMRCNLDSLLSEIASGRSEQASATFGPRLNSSLKFSEQLLADMRIYSQTPPMKMHTERLAPIVHDGIEMVLSEFQTNQRNTSQIELTVTIPADLTIPAFREQLVLVCRNLVKNAHEAILADTPRLGHIHVDGLQQDAWLLLRVSDDGIGLDERELNDVRQFIPGNSSKAGGTGFGLPIAQRYVSFHGGTIEIESIDGKGTVVSVRLPAEPGRAP
jgi:signal transduction histidine kinase